MVKYYNFFNKLFTNCEYFCAHGKQMLQAFLKLKKIVGSIIYTYNNGDKEEVVYFGGVKFVRDGDDIICKDMDYSDFTHARIINNPYYLNKMEKAILDAKKEEIEYYSGKHFYNAMEEYKIRKKEDRNVTPDVPVSTFFKTKIRGVCRFGEKLFEHLTEKDIENIKIELLVLSPKDVSYRYNISEYFCKKLYNESKKQINSNKQLNFNNQIKQTMPYQQYINF